jgi:methionine sulfoxide reductase heme-binding subunit
MSTTLATSASSLEWYLTRSTGAVALLLLTLTLALGVLDVKRWSTQRYPRFVIDSLHRNVSLLAICFLLVHILTSIVDGFAHISIAAAVIPFVGSYRPFWLGLGAISFDLIVAVILTSLMRARMGFASWRAIHWLTYASWPVALLHGLGTGSDVKSEWLLLMSIGCVIAVAACVLARTISGWPQNLRVRSAALASTGAFALFLLLWLPGGPLGSEWARRSGTPASLLAHHAPARRSGGKR